MAVQGDQIKLHLEIDDSQPVDEANWFRFNTAYSAKGQTGLYLMPQKDDQVELYLPEADEDQAYIRTVRRTDGADNEKTQDTQNKYLGNPYGKELRMTPDELKLTVSAGMYIKMSDDGIAMESDKEIIVKSEEDIELKGKSIAVTGGDNIYFQATGSSSMSMDNVTHFKADKIKLNGTVKR